MLFTRALLASTLAALASAQTNLPPIVAGSTTISGAQETHLASDLVAYFASLETQPAYTSVAGVLQTAIASDVLASLVTNTADQLATAVPTGNPAWFSALPGDVKSYISSVAAVESSIISKDLTGPAPTNRPLAVAAGVAAAGVGVVAMVL